MKKPHSDRFEVFLSLASSSYRRKILKILKSKGPLEYSELKYIKGTKQGKQSGIFAYHLRKLLRESLIELDRPSRLYEITGFGVQIITMAEKIRK